MGLRLRPARCARALRLTTVPLLCALPWNKQMKMMCYDYGPKDLPKVTKALRQVGPENKACLPSPGLPAPSL